MQTGAFGKIKTALGICKNMLLHSKFGQPQGNLTKSRRFADLSAIGHLSLKTSMQY